MLTVEEMIQQVRDVTDEDNIEDVSDEFILRMLNRAQQDLVSEITRKYNPYFLQEIILTPSDFSADVSGRSRVADLPATSFAFRISAVDAKIGDAWTPVRQVPFSYTLALDTSTGTSLPVVYSIQRNKLYVYPNVDSLVQIRVRFQLRPPKLVATQGRITEITDSSITLSDVPAGLSTTNTELLNYFNIIDRDTGAIKATLKVVGLSESTITYKTNAEGELRHEVFSNVVLFQSPTDVTLDDYVCHAAGTCVPYLSVDLTNYHVELAAFHTKRALGTLDTADYQERDRVIERLSKLWSGREYTTKIQRTRKFPLYSWQSFFRGS